MYTVYVKTGLTLISLSLFFVFFIIIIILRLKVCKSVFSEFKVVLYSPSESLGLFPKQLEDAGIYFWKPLPAKKNTAIQSFFSFYLWIIQWQDRSFPEKIHWLVFLSLNYYHQFFNIGKSSFASPELRQKIQTWKLNGCRLCSNPFLIFNHTLSLVLSYRH